MHSRFSCVIFDFDGTVADTGRGIFAGLRYAIAALSLPPADDSQLRRFIGPPIHQSFSEFYGLTGDLREKAVGLYREYYAERGIAELDVYPGMRELLERLRADGVQAAVASSKPQLFIDRVIQICNLEHLFSVYCGSVSDDAMESKAAIITRAIAALGETDVSRVLMVGDRHFDIAGAKEVGAASAGVLFGYGDERELREAGADFLAETPEQILSFL